MCIEDAVRLIILDYCEKHRMTPTEFSRKAKISKATISKIMNHKYGKIGISNTILDLIANGLDLQLYELNKLIKEYQNGTPPSTDNLEKERLVSLITKSLDKYNEEDLNILHRIILGSDSKDLKRIDIIINMK